MPQIFAHRGYHKEFAENTLDAISSAYAVGVTGVEIDVHLTRDEVWILNHDKDYYGTIISETSYEDLMELSDYYTHNLTLLEDVLTRYDDKKINIECKERDLRKGRHLAQFVETHRDPSTCLISSFSKSSLIGVRTFSDTLKMALLGLYLFPRTWKQFHRRYNLFSINPHYKFISNRLVRRANNNGLKVHAWTVNNERSIRSMIAHQVDAIITDDPELVRDILSKI